MVMYDSILARSFSRHEQKRLRYGAFVCCVLIALCFCTVLKPNLNPLPALKLQRSMGIKHKILALWETNSTQQVIKNVLEYPEMKMEEFENVSAQVVVDSDDQQQSASMEMKINTKEFENLSAQVVVDSDDQQQNASTLTSPIASSGQSEQTKIAEVVTKNFEPLCNTMEPRTEFCEINYKDVRVDAKSSSVFVVSSETGNRSWTIRPYARKEDKLATSHSRAWSVKPVMSDRDVPQCNRYHSVPAILFSNAGYTGNHFHEFTDIIVPLFITSRKYDGEIQFLISDMRPWWIAKFQAVLKGLSKYEIIDIDKEDAVHCFPSVTLGLKRHEKELSIDPSKHTYSMKDFREFLRNSYSLKRANAIRIKDGTHRRKKPQLLIIPRRRTRSFTNIGEIAKMARRLGFKVIVAEAGMDLSKFSEVVNSCDVLMGVHGAGLTNILFLPENAVFIQILPLGGFEWLATTYFGEPSQDMNLKYLEYKISNEESTLIQQYPLDHAVFTDPYSFGKRGWEVFKSIFLDKQNVKLNVHRFRPTLLKALELLHQ